MCMCVCVYVYIYIYLYIYLYIYRDSIHTCAHKQKQWEHVLFGWRLYHGSSASGFEARKVQLGESATCQTLPRGSYPTLFGVPSFMARTRIFYIEGTFPKKGVGPYSPIGSQVDPM